MHSNWHHVALNEMWVIETRMQFDARRCKNTLYKYISHRRKCQETWSIG